MGYYSEFDINTDPPTAEVTLSKHYGLVTDETGKCPELEEKFTWYDWRDDVLEASAKNPGVLITVLRQGEGDWMRSDMEIAFFKGGKSYSAEVPQWTPPEFDESELV